MKIFAIAIVVFVAAVFVIRSVRKQKALQQGCRDAFDSVFSGSSAIPTYQQSYSYGYPAFTITFASESELVESRSRGLTKQFGEKISELCKDSGSKKHPFDVERAIWFTYEREIVTSQVNNQ